jgi:hypothetical protein
VVMRAPAPASARPLVVLRALSLLPWAPAPVASSPEFLLAEALRDVPAEEVFRGRWQPDRLLHAAVAPGLPAVWPATSVPDLRHTHPQPAQQQSLLF